MNKKHIGIVAITLSLAILASFTQSYKYKYESLKTSSEREFKQINIDKLRLEEELKKEKITLQNIKKENESLKKSISISAKKYYKDGTIKSEFTKNVLQENTKQIELRDLAITEKEETISIKNMENKEEKREKESQKTEVIKEEKTKSNWGFVLTIFGGVAAGYLLQKSINK